MKNTIKILAIIFASTFLNGQVTIGKANMESPSSILDFNDEALVGGELKGIIMPIVESKTSASDAVPGTILMSAQDNKVMYRKNANEWIDMTNVEPNVNVNAPALKESPNSGVVISDGYSTTAPGALKLDSNSKAMVLPRVKNIENSMPNPEPGTMVYDMNSKSIAIFNGNSWYFWN